MTTQAPAPPIGPAMPDWTPRPRPPRTPMAGRTCRVEPLDLARHADDLFHANAADATGRNWTYLSDERPPDRDSWRAWLARHAAGDDPLVHAVVDAAAGRAAGIASYMRIDPANGVIEIGHINFAPRLQRTVAASEALILMIRRAFDELGYRRVEWKCDSLNAPSRAAALRLGFRYEGTFRQAAVYKHRNRDTAWFAIIDADWPALRDVYAQWLERTNFGATGYNRTRLSDLTAALAK